MVTSMDRNLRARLPERRHERFQVILVRHRWQAGEDVAQVKQWIDAPAMAGNDDRVQDRGALASLGMSYKKPIFDTKLGRPDAVLHDVGVELRDAVVEMFDQRCPKPQRVVTSLVDPRLRQRTGA